MLNIKQVILIREDQKSKLDQVLPWGDFSPMMRMIIDDFLEIMQDKEQAKKVFSAYMNRKAKLSDISPMLKGEANE